jgi:hypothetical protein
MNNKGVRPRNFLFDRQCHGGNMENKIAKLIRTSAALSSAVAVSVLVFAPYVYAADPLGPSLCTVLKELIPEVMTYRR